MLKLPICNLLLLISTLSFAQVSSNVSFLGNWDDNSLRVLGTLSFNDIWGYTDENFNEYGIIGSAEYTHFIDIRDPKNPREIARIAGPSLSLWRDIKTYRHYAYSVSDNGSGSLQIFDLSGLPDVVTKVYDSQAFFTNCHNIFIDEVHGRLYAVGTNKADIVILDLKENPANPVLLKNITLSEGYVHDIYVRDHIGYASHVYKSKLTVYDFTNMDSINAKVLGSLSNYVDAGLNHSSWLSENGKILTMADENRGLAMKVVDVSDLTDIEVVSTFKSALEAGVATNSIPHNPFIIGDKYAVVSYYHDGVQIYNIEDPANPVRAGYYDTYPNNTNYIGGFGSWGVFPFFPSGNIIASDITNGLFVLKPTFDLGYCRKTVYSASVFEKGEQINTHASESILLENGFHAQAGSEFSASIQACTGVVKSIEGLGTIAESAFSLEVSGLSTTKLLEYPNPFTNEFKLVGTIITELPTSAIHLINNLGQMVPLSISNCGTDCRTVQTGHLSSGVYTILIKQSGGAVLSRKVVKF